MFRTARAVTVMLLLWGSIAGIPTASSQGDLEILSKADALQLFAMSKQQWQQNVAAVVAARLGTRAGDGTGLSIKTPVGYVITRPDYSRDNSMPAFVQVTVAYPPGGPIPPFTDALAAEAIAHAQQQMAPEFDVIGNMERVQGGLAFFFIISERPKERSSPWRNLNGGSTPLRINRVLRVMLHTHWSMEAWSQVRVEFKRALALRSQVRRAGWFN